jgi:branched-chain amino acid transport system ATP-binding protein
MTLLSIEALEVRYGAVPALRGVALTVGAGEAVALLGANGSGKSTLMKSVIGLLRPAAGRILFDGGPIEALRADRRARLGIGYCPEGRRVFAGMTVRENLLVACWGNG